MDKKLKDEIIKQQGELLYTTLGEECSEVIQACSKIIRKKFYKEKFDVDNLLEEICDLEINLELIKEQLSKEKCLNLSKEEIDRRIENGNPMESLKYKRNMLSEYNKRMNLLIQRLLMTKLNEFKLLSSKLEVLNPLSIMEKGYSISSIDEKIITDVNMVNVGDIMVTKMKNGEIRSVVKEVIRNGKE